jgi:hypothetical protein
MKSRLSSKLAVLMFIGALVALSIAACGETADCKNLRETTYASKRSWDACDPNEQNPCIKVPGNQKDCTGVLTCDFAVNRHYRDLAEMAVYKIGEQSQGCFHCAVPNCIAGEIPYCEPVSQRCIIVTEVIDGGGFVQGSTDSGTPLPDGNVEIPDTSVTDTGGGDALLPN